MKRPQATGWAPGSSRKSGVSLAKAPSASCVGLPSPSAARPQREGRASQGYARNAVAAGLGRGKGQPAPRGWVEGLVCRQPGRGPPLFSPTHCPGPAPPGLHGGRAAQNSFQMQPQLRTSKQGLCLSPEEASVGRGGSCSVPAAPPTTTATSQGNCLKKCPPIAPGQSSEPGRQRWASNQWGPARRGARTRSLIRILRRCFCILVIGPWA